MNINYFDELCRAMTWMAEVPDVLFMGQGVGCAGTSMTDTLNGVPKEKLLEVPVAEDMQMGMATGMALEGVLPVCIFPRWNFLLLAANQLINHLDRLPIYSDGGYQPKVIIRTAVPSTQPFNPGAQHDADFTDAIYSMLRTINVVKLLRPGAIVAGYKTAVFSSRSTLLVEYTDQYRSVVPTGLAGMKDV